ncbi:C4-type zinc ribbon domain-containing protein [soil metagenome]
MSGVEQLLDVQAHDTRADQLRHRLEHLPERAQLVERRAELAQVLAAEAGGREERDRLGREQKRLEDEVAGLDDKAAQVDRTLYSGTVNAPRELQALQDELGALARRKSHLEDIELEIMERTEPVDAALARLDTERAQHQASIESLERSLADNEGGTRRDLADTEAARTAAAASIDADLLAVYDRLRSQLQGVAVARLVGTTCGGCHLGLSAVEVDRIRSAPADAVVHCEECGRILVHS